MAMGPQQKRVGGIVLTVVGGLLLLALFAFALFDIYVLIDDRGSDAETAWPLLGGTCCCSLIAAGIIGAGVYFTLGARKDADGGPHLGE